MIYHWIYPLHQWITPLNVIRYITFRTASASLTALLLSLILGPWMIRRLKQMQIGQYIREDGPSGHHTKAGTPTMGGVMIVANVLVPTLLWADLGNAYVWIAMGSILCYGGIGFWDDFRKISGKRSLGLKGWSKFGWQTLVALGIAGLLILLYHHHLYSLQLSVPFFKKFTPTMDLRIAGHSTYLPFIGFVALVVVGCSNAVNLTDGLDGLAAGSVVIASTALTVLTYVTAHATFAVYLDLIKNTYASELTIFCGAMAGSTLGFLWYNTHPAEVFMGDVGSNALGGAIGTVAVLIKQELLLPFIGGIFVIEALSVIMQVGSYRLRGKRVFRMAPVHHDFELRGWKEPKVVVRFWIIALIFALFSLTTLKLR